MKIGEQVLVVPTEHLNVKFTNGWYDSLDNSHFLNSLLENSKFVDRKKAETDESIKQLIPYCVLKHDNKFFCYKRGKKGTESRLHAKWSLGAGGHINPDNTDIKDNYWNSLFRELKEEIGLSKRDCAGVDLGFIYDDSNEVGRVHLGMCHLILPMTKTLELKFENTIDEHSWERYDKMLEMMDMFEGWSQIVLKAGVLK